MPNIQSDVTSRVKNRTLDNYSHKTTLRYGDTCPPPRSHCGDSQPVFVDFILHVHGSGAKCHTERVGVLCGLGPGGGPIQRQLLWIAREPDQPVLQPFAHGSLAGRATHPDGSLVDGFANGKPLDSPSRRGKSIYVEAGPLRRKYVGDTEQGESGELWPGTLLCEFLAGRQCEWEPARFHQPRDSAASSRGHSLPHSIGGHPDCGF